MPIAFEQLSSPTLRVRIAEKLREAILNGTLREGERLVERKLAAEFATSLTAVREALIELESDGFVVKKPNSSTYVTKLTWEAAQHVFAVRRLLEVFAIEEAARLATPEDIASLEGLYLSLLDAARNEDVQLFIQRDFALHTAIWELARNECLSATLRRVALPIFAASAIRIATRGAFDLAQDAQLHLPLLDAIRLKDPVAARKAMEESMQAWLDQARAHMFGR
ncbi:MAG: GntR family transcriptional regulator [Bryobacteraceae bacterium]